MISDKMQERWNDAVAYTLARHRFWLSVRKQEVVAATRKDCMLCPGLEGALVIPGAGTLTAETISEAIAEHDHRKFVYVEVFRQPAHFKRDGQLRITPNDPQPFTAADHGVYQIAALYEDNAEVMSVDLGGMTAGMSIATTEIEIAIML